MFDSSLPPVVCMRVDDIFTLFVFACVVVSNTYCVVILFCFSLPCVHYDVSFSGLSIFDSPNFLIWDSSTFIYIVLTFLSALHKHELFDTINMVVSNHFHSVTILLYSSTRSHDFDGMQRTGLPVSTYTTKTSIDMCRFNVRSSAYKNVLLKTDIN